MLNMDVFVVLISVFMSMLPGNFFNWHLIKFGEVCKHRDRARERDLSIEWKMEKRNKLWLKIKWNISSGQSFIINNTLKWSEEKKTSKINGKRCIGVCVCICPYVAVIPLAVDSNGYRNVVIFLIKQTHIKKKIFSNQNRTRTTIIGRIKSNIWLKLVSAIITETCSAIYRVLQLDWYEIRGKKRKCWQNDWKNVLNISLRHEIVPWNRLKSFPFHIFIWSVSWSGTRR